MPTKLEDVNFNLRELLDLWSAVKESSRTLNDTFEKIVEGLVHIQGPLTSGEYEKPRCRCGGEPKLYYRGSLCQVQCQRCGMQTDWRAFEAEAMLDWAGVMGEK